MSDFTFLYRGRDTNASPEQMQKTMEKWRAWFKQLGDNGRLKDIGHPLENSGKVVKGKQKSVTDGPFAEAKDVCEKTNEGRARQPGFCIVNLLCSSSPPGTVVLTVP